jgi:hypothetical protein
LANVWFLDIAAQPSWSELTLGPLEEEEESNDDIPLSSYLASAAEIQSSRQMLPRLLPALLPPPQQKPTAPIADIFDDAKSVPEDLDTMDDDLNEEEAIRTAARIQRSLDSLQLLADSLEDGEEEDENNDDIQKLLTAYYLNSAQEDVLNNNNAINNNDNGMLLTMRRRQRRDGADDSWTTTVLGDAGDNAESEVEFSTN